MPNMLCPPSSLTRNKQNVAIRHGFHDFFQYSNVVQSCFSRVRCVNKVLVCRTLISWFLALPLRQNHLSLRGGEFLPFW